MMQVLTVNVGQHKEVVRDGKAWRTSIYKEPVAGPVRVGRLGLVGDTQTETSVHGGVDQAVYAYPIEHCAYWMLELERAGFGPGYFGENLMVEGLVDGDVAIGDVFAAGSTVLEVTVPRLPCATLAMRIDDKTFPKRMLASGRLGWYMRVLEEGEIEAGDEITRVRRPEDLISVDRIAHLRFDADPDRGLLRRAAALPALKESWRELFVGKLG